MCGSRTVTTALVERQREPRAQRERGGRDRGGDAGGR